MTAQQPTLKRTGPLAPPAVGPGQRPLVRQRGDRFDYFERIVLPPRATATTTAPGSQQPAQAPRALTLRDDGGTHAPDDDGARERSVTRVTGLALLLAALQLVVGYEWLVSGVDKLLDGTFPDQLGSLIGSVASGGRLPEFFAQFLQQIVLPNGYVFGWAVEVGETLTGAGLFAGALFILLGPSLRARLTASAPRRLLGAVGVLTVVAAFASLALAANYYLLDGLPTPWFQPSFAVGGAIDSSLLLALFSLVILLGRATIREARE